MRYKKALIIGANGMLGKAFFRVLRTFDIEPLGIAKSGSDYSLDLTNTSALPKIIKESKADIVINCAAIVSLLECERNPVRAAKINSDLVNFIGKACFKYEKKFIHISTDHFYLNDKRKLHTESEDIKLVNQYAKTKRMGELNALRFNDSLIVRTNITGLRGNKFKPTFFEWLYDSVIKKSNISLFTDFYTTTISAEMLAKYSILASNLNVKGLINIASSECISKKEFALLLADNLHINFDWFEEASVKSLKPQRADSLGLNCSKIENILNIKMPTANEVIQDLLKSLKK